MAYDLVAIAGPVAGERFPLPKGQEVLIGRTRSGVNLPDPLVSVKHAVLTPIDKGGYTVKDLGSATGTKVNGEPIAPDKAVPIDVGDVLLIGECELRVDSGGSRVLRRILWAMTPAWGLLFVSLVALWWITGDRPVSLNTAKPIRTNAGAVKRLVIPKTFIRQHALEVTQMRLRRTTDFDANGIDELWLYVGNDEMVVTFAPDGSWTHLGTVPRACVDRAADSAFPDLFCDGIDYRFIDSRYRAIAQIDPVVWLYGEPAIEYEIEIEEEIPVRGKAKKAKSPEEENPRLRRVDELRELVGVDSPVPYRIALTGADRLAGFLASQGVVDRIHYLVCEDAFPGVPAQVLLEEGRVMPLTNGCADAQLEGPRSPAFEGTHIAAIAFTAVGREMLPKHLAYTWSGAPDPLMVPTFYRNFVETVSRWPIPLKGGIFVTFAAAPTPFHPLATNPVMSERVRLIADDAINRPAITATLLSEGVARLDPEGCSALELRTSSFRCATMYGCLPGARFIEVVDVGCSDEPQVVVSAGYKNGSFSAETDDVEVRVEITVQEGMLVTDVIQARVGARATR